VKEREEREKKEKKVVQRDCVADCVIKSLVSVTQVGGVSRQ
jgi:hypothetical protein